jgi:hypothetical protein
MSWYKAIIPCHLFLTFLNFHLNLIYINIWGQNINKELKESILVSLITEH